MPSLVEIISPSLVLSLTLAVLWATLWFVWRGQTAGDWVIDVLAALLGFAAGQLLAELLKSPLPAIGETRVIEGTLLALLALWLVDRWRRQR